MVAEALDEPQQLDLLEGRLPHRPYCCDDLGSGLVVRDAARALERRYVQLNPPAIVYWIPFDLDRADARTAHEPPQIQPPNLLVENPENGHGHALYGLAVPVVRTDAGRIPPLRYAAAVEGAYRQALDADEGYAGLICKTPHHPDWRTLQLTDRLYTLQDLAACIPDLNRRPEADRRRRLDCGLGRNVWLFERVRWWAYRKVVEVKRDGAGYGEWHTLVLAQATTYNDYPVPLPTSEVKATAKSVAKWTWRHFSPEAFSAIQKARGHRTGRKDREVLGPKAHELAAKGHSLRDIADALGKNKDTIAAWLKRDPEAESTKPAPRRPTGGVVGGGGVPEDSLFAPTTTRSGTARDTAALVEHQITDPDEAVNRLQEAHYGAEDREAAHAATKPVMEALRNGRPKASETADKWTRSEIKHAALALPGATPEQLAEKANVAVETVLRTGWGQAALLNAARIGMRRGGG